MAITQVRGIVEQWARATVGPQLGTGSIATFVGVGSAANPAFVPAPTTSAEGTPPFAPGYGSSGFKPGASAPLETIVDSIIVTNPTGSSISYTIARVPNTVTQAAPAQDLYTAVPLAGNTTIVLTSGAAGVPLLYLGAGDILTVKGAALNFSVNVRTEREDFG